MTVDASTQKQKFSAYSTAFADSRSYFMGMWHPAWREYHRMYTRRRHGRPTVPRRLDDMPSGAYGDDEQDQPGWCDPDSIRSVNYVQQILRTIMASTFNADPEFTFRPLFEGQHAPLRASAASRVLNRAWSTYNFSEPCREAAYDSLLYGIGFVRISWRRQSTGAPQGPPDQRIRDGASMVGQVGRKGVGMEVMIPDKVDLLREFGSDAIPSDGTSRKGITVIDRPVVRRVSPFDMFWDLAAESMDDIRWIAQRWKCPIAEAKRRKAWSKTARDDLAATFSNGDSPFDMTGPRGSRTEYSGSDTVEIIDFYDVQEGTWCQFAVGGSGFLLSPEPCPLPFGQPFRWITGIVDSESTCPISVVENIWPLQKQIDLKVDQISEDLRQTKPRLFVDQGINDQVEDGLTAADSGLVVPVAGLRDLRTINDVLQPFTPPSRVPELMQLLNADRGSMTEASGVSDYLRGGALTGQSATAVAAMQTSAANFMGVTAQGISKFLQQVGASVFVCIQTFSRIGWFITMPVPAEDGTTSQETTVRLGKEVLAGQFEVIVTGGSTQEKSPQAEAVQAQQLVSAAMPFVQAGVVDPAMLWNKVASMLGVDDPASLMTPAAKSPFGKPDMAQAPGVAAPGSVQAGSSQSDPAMAGAMTAVERTISGQLPSQQASTDMGA